MKPMSGHAVLTAETVDDCVIDQGWDRYSAEDHTIWRMLLSVSGGRSAVTSRRNTWTGSRRSGSAPKPYPISSE